MSPIHPSFWGPDAWALLHSMAEHQPLKVISLVESLQIILPCPKCRVNLSRHITAMENIGTASQWIYDLHNRVRASQTTSAAGPVNPPPSLAEVSRVYKNRELKLTNISNFLEAIVESHPGGQKIDSVYMGASLKFWQIVMGIFGSKAPPKSVLISRPAIRVWLHDFQKRHGVKGQRLGKHQRCNDDICII